MRYLSVCSGIEAATVAWHHLGWEPAAFSEIEPFPSAVLKHHYPHVPNLGDMTKHKEWNLGPIDLLVGGTPCQSFSVAGLRQGLHDPRGGLMLTFLEIAQRHRPRWVVWENVPGVLSSNGGRDFGAFLGALGELGYGWAYRVLDAQWFGVAQRRRRVFVVGCLGDQASAAAVCAFGESVCRDFEKSGKARQGVARGALPGVAGSLDTQCGGGKLTHQSVANGHLVPATWWDGGDIAATLTTQNAGGGQRMPDKDNLGAVLQPIAFHPTQDPISSIDGCHALSGGSKQGTASAAVAFKVRGGVEREDGSRGSTNIGKQAGKGYLGSDELAFTVASSPDQWIAQPAMQVRRLTPVECERLQGFPDGYTNIPWRKKPEAPDGPRYKALGNSMAVPCMRWIGERIDRATKEATP